MRTLPHFSQIVIELRLSLIHNGIWNIFNCLSTITGSFFNLCLWEKAFWAFFLLREVEGIYFQNKNSDYFIKVQRISSIFLLSLYYHKIVVLQTCFIQSCLANSKQDCLDLEMQSVSGSIFLTVFSLVLVGKLLLAHSLLCFDLFFVIFNFKGAEVAVDCRDNYTGLLVGHRSKKLSQF